MITADVDRIPLRNVVDGVGDHVGDQPKRRPGRKYIGATRKVFLDDVVLRRALERTDIGSLLFCGSDIQREQPHCGGVDSHRRVHLVERDAIKQSTHIADVSDGHAHLAHFTTRHHAVGVVAGLCRQVEGDGEAGLALGQVAAIERVGLSGRGVAGIGAHQPRAILRHSL